MRGVEGKIVAIGKNYKKQKAVQETDMAMVKEINKERVGCHEDLSGCSFFWSSSFGPLRFERCNGRVRVALQIATCGSLEVSIFGPLGPGHKIR